ncbi:WIF domain [Trinorchestia longiramus]|nr:WIF domain [Trinorchestia longiramus]
MGWTVPVPAHVHALHFIWRATDNTPLLYNIALRTDDTEKDDSQDTKSKDRLDEKKQSRKQKTKDKKDERKGPVVLAPPYLNISLSGNVPTEPTTFTLHLPCTGAASAEVDVTLNINVTSPRPNLPPIELYFRRRKICLQGQSSEAYAPHQDPKEEVQSLVSPTLYYGLCGAGALLMVLLSILGAAFVRRRIREKRHRDHCTLTSNCGSDQKSRAGTSSSLLSPISNNVYTPTNHTYTPSTHTYTLPSSVTSNCYASLTQLPVSPTQTLPHPPTQTLPRDSSSANAQEHSVSAASLATPAGNTSVASLTYGPMSTASLSHPAKISASLARDCSLPTFRPTTTGSQGGSKNCTLTTMASGNGSRNSTLNKRELLVDPCMAHMQESFKHLQVDRRRVRLTCVLLEGRYGRLYRGCIQADSPHPDTQVTITGVGEDGAVHDNHTSCVMLQMQVLVKTVQCSAGQQQVRQLCREVVRLSTVQHRTLLSLAAVSLGASVPPLLIFPDIAFHNLKILVERVSETGEFPIICEAASGVKLFSKALAGAVLHFPVMQNPRTISQAGFEVPLSRQ